MPGLVVLTSAPRTAAGARGPERAGRPVQPQPRHQPDPEGDQAVGTWLVGDAVAGGDATPRSRGAGQGPEQRGIFNDAPDVVADANGDGDVDGKNLRALGVASNVVRLPFHIRGAPA